MAEAIDRLELVADEETFVITRPTGEEIDQLALQPVRVLELVDHDRTEAQLLSLSDRLVVPQKIARAQLQVLEVECGFAVLSLLIRGGEAGEQLLQQIAAGRSERLVHAGEHAAHAARSVHVEQPKPRRVVRCAEGRKSGGERLTTEDAPLALVEHAKPRVDTGCERMGAQQSVTEAVNRRDPRSVELAREVRASALDQSGTDPAP